MSGSTNMVLSYERDVALARKGFVPFAPPSCGGTTGRGTLTSFRFLFPRPKEANGRFGDALAAIDLATWDV